MSEEHIWPQWMHDILPDSTHYIEERYNYPASTEVNRRIGSLLQRERQGAPKTKRLPVVCVPCNSGWMSRLEGAVAPFFSPMIQNSFAAISASRRRLLTQWFVLKTMVIEHDRSMGLKVAEIVHPAADRSDFMNHAQIPPGFRLWLGAGHGPEWKLRVSHYVGGAVASPTPFVPRNFDPTRLAKNVQSVTWGIGHVRAFVASTVDRDVYRLIDWDLPNFVRLWPPDAPDFIWPPGSIVPDRQMFNLARRMMDLADAAAAARKLMS